MASIRNSEYRGFSLETRASQAARGFDAGFTFFSTTSSVADRITRNVDGPYKTEDEAHTAATLAAKKLIDLLLDDVLGSGR